MSHDKANQVGIGEDPIAADAALQRLRRAREAEAATTALSKIENVEALLGDLGDLEVGAGKISELIEVIGELDSADKGALPKAEAQDTLDEAPREPTELQNQIRAAHVKYSGGGVDVSSDDPLAKEKKKAAKALEKVGRTLADLPVDFWTLSRNIRNPEDRSRQSEFHAVILEGQEEMREAERLQELKKRGLPVNYHLLSRDEKDRINTNARQQRHRDKTRKPPSKPTVAPLPVAAADMLSSTERHEISRSLDRWTRTSSTPLAPQLRKPEQQRALIRALAAYAWYFTRHSKPPSRSDLAKMLRCTEGQARRRLDVLKSLYAPSGPWARA